MMEEIPKIRALFFPSKDSEHEIIQKIDTCTREMLVCVYTITNTNIIDAIIKKVNENSLIQCRIITDDVQTQIPSQRDLLVKLLSAGKNQVQVKLDVSPLSLMHNKYLTIDDSSVLTGSFNWTKKAVSTNKENLVIIDHTETTRQFKQNFELLWSEFLVFTGQSNEDIQKEQKDIHDKVHEEKKNKQQEQTQKNQTQKQLEKEQKQAEKQAEKLRKMEEKEKLKQEKAAQKQVAKQTKNTSKKGGKKQQQIEEEDNSDDQEPAPRGQRSKRNAQIQRSNVKKAKAKDEDSESISESEFIDYDDDES